MIYLMIMLGLCAPGHQETDIPDGTLLFVEGGNKLVRDFTDSPYSHVAVIFNIDGEPWVYEAIKPRVRKIKLDDYMKEIQKENEESEKLMKVWIRRPKVPIDTKAMREYSEKMLGTKYSISSYLTGEPRKNHIHCGELTARTMLAGTMQVHGNPCTKSPQGIMNLCRPYYHEPRML